MGKIWYYANGQAYPENEPNYFEVKDFPELKAIEEHWTEIKQELIDFIKQKDAGFISNSYQGVKVEGGWNSLTFMFWGLTLSKEFNKKCPVFMKYLQQIDGLVTISLSRLQANSSIARHRGDTNAVARCHLGIEIPAPSPICAIKVAEEERGWAEGKWMLFNDAYIHSAWNNADKRRIVMIIDVIRPEFLEKKNNICTHILTYQILNNRLGRNRSYKDSSWFVKNVLYIIVFAIILIYKPLHNMIKG